MEKHSCLILGTALGELIVLSTADLAVRARLSGDQTTHRGPVRLISCSENHFASGCLGGVVSLWKMDFEGVWEAFPIFLNSREFTSEIGAIKINRIQVMVSTIIARNSELEEEEEVGQISEVRLFEHSNQTSGEAYQDLVQTCTKSIFLRCLVVNDLMDFGPPGIFLLSTGNSIKSYQCWDTSHYSEDSPGPGTEEPCLSEVTIKGALTLTAFKFMEDNYSGDLMCDSSSSQYLLVGLSCGSVQKLSWPSGEILNQVQSPWSTVQYKGSLGRPQALPEQILGIQFKENSELVVTCFRHGAELLNSTKKDTSFHVSIVVSRLGEETTAGGNLSEIRARVVHQVSEAGKETEVREVGEGEEEDFEGDHTSGAVGYRSGSKGTMAQFQFAVCSQQGGRELFFLGEGCSRVKGKLL